MHGLAVRAQRVALVDPFAGGADGVAAASGGGREHFFSAVYRASSESAPSLRIFTSPSTGRTVRRM